MMNFESARKRMVEELREREITDERVLKAMRKVERHKFIDVALQSRAYEDCSLPIGFSQTISQPYIVALMTQSLALNQSSKVLEIGTGSGYQAAILSEICSNVFTIEQNTKLAERTRQLFDQMGLYNIALRIGNGSEGWYEFVPFDGIIVTAAASFLPDMLLKQLKDGGRLVIPIGESDKQTLKLYIKNGDDIETSEICECSFVPLI